MTDFVPYIDNNLSLFSNKNKEYISGIDNNKSKEYIVQNLLTEVTFENDTYISFIDTYFFCDKIKSSIILSNILFPLFHRGSTKNIHKGQHQSKGECNHQDMVRIVGGRSRPPFLY